MYITASVNKKYNEGIPGPDEIFIPVMQYKCIRVSPIWPNIENPLNVCTHLGPSIFLQLLLGTE